MAIQRAVRQYRAGFVFVDGLAVCAAFLMANIMRHGTAPAFMQYYLYALPYVVLIFLASFRSFGVYSSTQNGLREAFKVVCGVAAGMSAVLALSFFYRGFSYSRLTAVYFSALAFIMSLHLRYLYRAVLDLVFGNSQWLKRVLVVGNAAETRLILAELLHSKSDYLPIGIVTRSGSNQVSSETENTIPVLGTVKDATAIMDQFRPDLLILADPAMSEDEQGELIEACLDRNIHWRALPRVGAPADQIVDVTIVGGVALLGSKGNNITGFNYVLKRVIDVVIAGTIAFMFAPLMITVAVLIKLFSRGPVLFVQERVGYRGRPFRFYKFRSMHVSNDDRIHREFVAKWINNEDTAEQVDHGVVVHKLTRDPRIIPVVGAFIRKFSVDELPQLFNVIKGDMSLVGPRPCLPYEVEMYRRWHKMRFDALPGITGLWQVSGRNRLTFDQMVALDIRYLQHWSLQLDLSIIARTPYVVLFDKAY